MEKLNWDEATAYLRKFNRDNGITSPGSCRDKKASIVVVIKQSSFEQEGYKKDADGNYIQYSELERSYLVQNDNKAFIDGMCGYSIFAVSLDGSDHCRLENYLKDEGVKNGWEIEYCYIKE